METLFGGRGSAVVVTLAPMKYNKEDTMKDSQYHNFVHGGDMGLVCYICGETEGYHEAYCSAGNKSRPKWEIDKEHFEKTLNRRRLNMTRAAEFSKRTQDDLTEITGNRPTHQFMGILFSVTNDGNIGMHSCESEGTPQPAQPTVYEPAVGLKFAQWIQNTFGPDSTEEIGDGVKTKI